MQTAPCVRQTPDGRSPRTELDVRLLSAEFVCSGDQRHNRLLLEMVGCCCCCKSRCDISLVLHFDTNKQSIEPSRLTGGLARYIEP